MTIANEYLTGNRYIRYPFKDNSVITVNDEPNNDYSLVYFGCFVDAAIQLKPNSKNDTPIVTDIRLENSTLYFSLARKSNPGDKKHLICTKSKSKFPVIRGYTDWCWYTFTISAASIIEGIEELKSLDQQAIGSPNLTNLQLEFNTRCVGIQPNMLTSLHIYEGDKPSLRYPTERFTVQEILEDNVAPDCIISTGDVSLTEGYNMSFAPNSIISSITPLVDSINISAVPGAGAGVAPCPCTDDVDLSKFRLKSSNGHVCIINDSCYDLYPQKVSEQQAVVKFIAKCTACCTCDMYASLVENRLAPIKDEILANKNSIDSTLNKYEEYVQKWNERLVTVLPEDITITATGVGLDAVATDLKESKTSGYLDRCGFSINITNNAFLPVEVEITKISAHGSIHELQLTYMDDDFNPVILHKITEEVVTLAPGRSLLATGFLRKLKRVLTTTPEGYIIYAQVVVRHNDKEIINTKKKIVV